MVILRKTPLSTDDISSFLQPKFKEQNNVSDIQDPLQDRQSMNKGTTTLDHIYMQ